MHNVHRTQLPLKGVLGVKDTFLARVRRAQDPIKIYFEDPFQEKSSYKDRLFENIQN